MGYATCRSCKGSGRFYTNSGKTLDCKACGGSGSNTRLYETRCERCRTPMVYPVNQRDPRFCKDCRSIQLEKRCAQSGCTNTIRYNVGWDNVSSYCKRCEGKRQQGFSASLCPGTGFFGCGKIIWSPPGKNFSLCSDCGQRKKAEEDAKWREKSCPGLKGHGYCGKTIKYRIDWDKAPDICNDCKTKAKAERDRREANKRTKPCKHCGTTITYFADGKVFDYCKSCDSWIEKQCAVNGCSRTVRYKVYFDHIPTICKECKESKRNQQDRNKSTAFRDKVRGDNSGKRDIFFNRDGDGPRHGHAVQSDGGDGNTRYHYVRDEDGNVYVDDSEN